MIFSDKSSCEVEIKKHF